MQSVQTAKGHCLSIKRQFMSLTAKTRLASMSQYLYR